MTREYQHNFSDKGSEMFNHEGRRRKAETMVRVLAKQLGEPLSSLSVLNVGGSAGIIDEYLSRYFSNVTGIDIDEKAIDYAKKMFRKDGLTFEVGDALDTHFSSECFDVVICSQVYEHVADANVLMDEIFRILKPGGVVYFAAGNRLMFNEPHYNLPLLSVLPHYLADFYVRAAGKGDHYYEKHLTYWGLIDLVKKFKLVDYTRDILAEPERYGAEYMVKPGSLKFKISNFIAKYMIWLVPGYIWVLVKPVSDDCLDAGKLSNRNY